MTGISMPKPPMKYKYKGELLTWYYPASRHYGSGMGVYCDYCGKSLTHLACVGYEQVRGRDMCLSCLSRQTRPLNLKQKHKTPVLLENIPTHLHVINYGNLCVKETKVECHRCKKKAIHGMESSQGFYCLKCTHRLTKIMRPLDHMFIQVGPPGPIDHDEHS